jgi:ADP-ribose pyrophosphatase YjhB (NUDIX family)
MGILAGWQFCPRCGAGLTAVDNHLECFACGSEYWGNSLPGVQGLLERDGRLLLARRGREPRLGHWDLPGGFLEEGEAPLDGLRREFREETGLLIEAQRLLRIDIEPYGDRSVFSVSYLVTAAGEPVAADDVSELRWFGRDELPAEMAFPGQELVLREWRDRSYAAAGAASPS